MDKVKEKKKFSIQGTMGEKEYLEALKFLPGIFWERVLGGCLCVFVIVITLYFLAGASFSEALLQQLYYALSLLLVVFYKKIK